jgi:hypothetical protein
MLGSVGFFGICDLIFGISFFDFRMWCFPLWNLRFDFLEFPLHLPDSFFGA